MDRSLIDTAHSEAADGKPAAGRLVFAFGSGRSEGRAADAGLLGSKGANLAEMCRDGLPVPPGFTVVTGASREFLANGYRMPENLKAEVGQSLRQLEEQTGKIFGDPENPLLISVRSGASVSMPGMLDTILNLGMNDDTVIGLAKATGNPWFAADTYRRFVMMYSTVVLGVDHDLFDEIKQQGLAGAGVGSLSGLSAETLLELTARAKAAILEDYGDEFPSDPHDQLWSAIKAVFKSWMNPRAIAYRAAHNIDNNIGTAVTVQAMVFGNRSGQSGTGVAFTRDPSTGENVLYGEFLPGAQGEDIVSGIATPHSITREGRLATGSDALSMEEMLPDQCRELAELGRRLEMHFGDMQDIEFTVEDGKLWLLQARTGKRSATAAIRIAVEMAQVGIIDQRGALLRIDPSSLDQLLHPRIDPDAARQVIAKGLPAAPGAATGAIVFTSLAAQAEADSGQKVILVRPETNPEDIHGMHVAQGVLTSRGGMTSHAAVVARGMGKPCVTGVSQIRIDVAAGTLQVGDQTFGEGDIITIDGNTGEVIPGAMPMVQPEVSGDFATLMAWADSERRMKVRANAELLDDARVARLFGAEGIGLCRTEHVFLEHDEHLHAMRQYIMARDTDERRAAIERLLPMQRDDFVELFDVMNGLPVTVRLLDPPLSEFLPSDMAALDELASRLGMDIDHVRQRAIEVRDINPILGHRGARIAVTHPEIAAMQTRAIFEAAVLAGRKSGKFITPEIMVPLVSYNAELNFVRAGIDDIARKVMSEMGEQFDYQIGCIIEVPRAAIRADFIAESAEFFSFGTNDLTQTALGISRDDAANFLSEYLRKGIIELDPFINLDVEGVGELIRLASQKGRAVRPDLKLAISGEHGGDPVSIDFCEELGMHYVSCSPYRVPVARLAAAQAAIRHEKPGSVAAGTQT